jgi:surface antigen
LGEFAVLKKSASFSLLVAAVSVAVIAPAQAGKVYGNYGQGAGQYGNGQQDSGYYQDSNSSCNDVDIAVGTGLGGLVGGLIGNQFGKGSGNTAATIGGVILGGIAGNAIAKDACQDKRQDAHYYNNAYYDSFNDPQEDERYEWTNPYTSNHGYVSAGEYYDEGYQDFDGPCREFTQSVYIDGRPEQATGVACRQQDGTWRIVSGQ